MRVERTVYDQNGKLVRPMQRNADDETQQLNVEVQVNDTEMVAENADEQEDSALSRDWAAEGRWERTEWSVWRGRRRETSWSRRLRLSAPSRTSLRYNGMISDLR